MISSRGTAVAVEDDAKERAALHALLSQAGFDVVTAEDGPAGVDAVRRTSPLVTVVDLGVPGIDGIEVVKRIRTFSPTFIVMVTDSHDEVDVLQALNAGADAFIPRPFGAREFRARLEAILRRADAEFLEAAAAAAAARAAAEAAAAAASTPIDNSRGPVDDRHPAARPRHATPVRPPSTLRRTRPRDHAPATPDVWTAQNRNRRPERGLPEPEPYGERRPYSEQPYREQPYREQPYTEQSRGEQPYGDQGYDDQPYGESPYVEQHLQDRYDPAPVEQAPQGRDRPERAMDPDAYLAPYADQHYAEPLHAAPQPAAPPVQPPAPPRQFVEHQPPVGPAAAQQPARPAQPAPPEVVEPVETPAPPPVTEPAPAPLPEPEPEPAPEREPAPLAPPMSAAPAPAVPPATSGDAEWLQHRGLAVNPSTREVKVDGAPVSLADTEVDLLAALLSSGRRIRSRAELAVLLGGGDASAHLSPAARQAADVAMSRLLEKLGENPGAPRWIESVPGVGYRRASR